MYYLYRELKKDVCNGNDYSNRDGCWVTLRCEDEDEQEFSRQNSINSRNEELNELKKENLILREENIRLKDDKSKSDKSIIRKKKLKLFVNILKKNII